MRRYLVKIAPKYGASSAIVGGVYRQGYSAGGAKGKCNHRQKYGAGSAIVGNKLSYEYSAGSAKKKSRSGKNIVQVAPLVNYSTAKAGSFLVRRPALLARISPGVFVRAIPALRFKVDRARPSRRMFRAAFTSRS